MTSAVGSSRTSNLAELRRIRKKRRMKKQVIKLSIAILAFALIIGLGLQDFESIADDIHQEFQGRTAQNGSFSSSETAQNIPMISSSGLHSSHAVLVHLGENMEEDEIFLDKNADERMYPASMTKIMTALLVLENSEDLNTRFSLSQDIFRRVQAENLSVAGFSPDERVSIIDLLYGLMLPSGGECAFALAESVSGSEKSFVDLMNQKAEEIDMASTNFTNSTGSHDENHYSTARDMATLLEYALGNDTLYQIFTTQRYTTAATIIHAEGITFSSTLFSHMGGQTLEGGTILGGKTGYTSQAGQCLASLAEINGEHYILITAGAPGNNRTEILHIEDAIRIFGEI